MFNAVLSTVSRYAAYLVFGLALVSTAGSLVLSELMHLPPCVLCWYQRIFMYPVVAVVAVSILRRTREWMYTTLVLAVPGWLIALYHTLLQWEIIPEAAAPCVAGISCTTKSINWLGFITIPFMSWLAFSAILVLTVIAFQRRGNE